LTQNDFAETKNEVTEKELVNAQSNKENINRVEKPLKKKINMNTLKQFSKMQQIQS